MMHNSLTHGCPNYRIQSRTVSATGQHPNPHLASLK
jgi:hypothetical protein